MNSFTRITGGVAVAAVLAGGAALATPHLASAATSPSVSATASPSTSAAQAARVSVDAGDYAPLAHEYTVRGTAAPGSLVRVVLFDTERSATADATGAWSTTFTTWLTQHQYHGTATQITPEIGETVGFTVSERGYVAPVPVQPRVATTSYVRGAADTVVSGTGRPGTAITAVFRDDVRGTTVVRPDGTWSVVVGRLDLEFSVLQYHWSLGQESGVVGASMVGVSAPVAATSPAERPVAFTAPANPAAGYAPGTSFTFRGTATPGSTITLTNDKGTVIATGLPVGADGTWSWTRANLGTSTWKLTATATGGTAPNGTATIQRATLGAFAPIK